MIYNLANDLDRKRFAKRAEVLMQGGKVVDVTAHTFKTPNQNRYIHLLIGVVAMETGTTLEYAKEVYFKRLVNADTFVTTTEDRYVGKVATLRSTATLTKEEAALCIDRFIKWGDEQGWVMPLADDMKALQAIEEEMERMKAYL